MDDTPQTNGRDLRSWTFLHALRAALEGVARTIAQERNMRIHLMAAQVVFLFDLVLRPTLLWVVLTVAACIWVMAAEVMNTAVERAVDVAVGDKRHPVAKAAKDAAAGSVLLSALGACAVAYAVVVTSYPWGFLLFSRVHGSGAILAGIALATCWFFRWTSYRYIRR